MSMTKRALERFIRARNRSPFNNNLQFSIDLRECGMTVDDLGGNARAREDGGYEWDTPYGLLVEMGGQLRLEPAKED